MIMMMKMIMIMIMIMISAGACASIPSLTMSPECRVLLEGYSPSLFECQDNTSNLCSLNLCDKHAFIVDCGKK